jgi:KUP system potassium uptake protein
MAFGFWAQSFLCTTGAEALYSDLGPLRKREYQGVMDFVKACLIINYVGRDAWLLAHYKDPAF